MTEINFITEQEVAALSAVNNDREIEVEYVDRYSNAAKEKLFARKTVAISISDLVRLAQSDSTTILDIRPAGEKKKRQ